MSKGFSFEKKIEALKKAKVDLPNKIAQAGQLFFQQNFDKQTWNDVSWKRRVRETKKSEGHSLLVSTGTLRASLQNCILHKDYKNITFGSNVPYATYLNFGTDKMVARPFFGNGNDNKQFNGKIKRIVKKEFDKIMLNK